MTELYIDGQQVILSEDFSITLIDENPFFTKNGTYTYDIDIDLTVVQNARIYKHLNRFNSVADLKTTRSAYMVVDNEVVLNGTEIVLDWTNTVVKIQLASGNSELNFLIGGDMMLRDLELGEATKYHGLNGLDKAKQVLSDFKKNYPEVNYLPLPFVAGYGQNLFEDNPTKTMHYIGNNFYFEDLEYFIPDGNQEYSYPFFNGLYSGVIQQPFLCFIIERVIEFLGYTIAYNAIAKHETLNKLYIVHGFRTTKFAKMLPGWTVNEFIEQIEHWLDCVFLVNSFEKTVSIYFNYESGANDETIQLSLLDEYTVEQDKDNMLYAKASNMAYDIDQDDYMDFMHLNDFVRDKAKYDHQSRMATEMLSYLSLKKDELSEVEKGKIYSFTGDVPSDSKFIIYTDKSNKYTLKTVDSFEPWMKNTNSEEIDFSLKIIPASMQTGYLIYRSHYEGANKECWVQYAVAEDYDDLKRGRDWDEDEEEEYYINIQEEIEQGERDRNDIGHNKMRLALYAGLQNPELKYSAGKPSTKDAYYPVCLVEGLSENLSNTQTIHLFHQDNPFRFAWLNEFIYKRSTSVDTTSLYKLSFLNNKKINVTANFIANNKRFRCKQIERTITPKGFGEIVKGEFYPYE